MNRAKAKLPLESSDFSRAARFLAEKEKKFTTRVLSNGKIGLYAAESMCRGQIVLCWPGDVTSGTGIKYKSFTFSLPTSHQIYLLNLSVARENLEPLKSKVLLESPDGNCTFTSKLFFQLTEPVEAGERLYYDFYSSGSERAQIEVILFFGTSLMLYVTDYL